MMESICDLIPSDILRLCSAVIDAVNRKTNLKQTYHLFNEKDPCLLQPVEDREQPVWTNMLRCSVIDRVSKSTPFYLMADCRERGAVFVFLAASGEKMKLHTRVTKIGAILNPQGPNEVQICTDDASNIQEEERPWHSITRIQHSSKRGDQRKPRKKKNTDSNDESSGSEDWPKTRLLSDIYNDPKSLQIM